MTQYTSTGVGPAAGAVASGAIATSTNTDSSTTTTTITPQNTTTVGGANYAAQFGLGPDSSYNNITSTTTDFGAIAAAQGIATTAINQNSQDLQTALAGQAQLNQITGQALNTEEAALLAKATPLSQTVAKYGTWIVGIIGGVIVLGLLVIVWGAADHEKRKPKPKPKEKEEEAAA